MEFCALSWKRFLGGQANCQPLPVALSSSPYFSSPDLRIAPGLDAFCPQADIFSIILRDFSPQITQLTSRPLEHADASVGPSNGLGEATNVPPFASNPAGPVPRRGWSV